MVRANVVSLILGAALAAGCAENPLSIQIRQNNAPDPDEGCISKAEADTPGQPKGVLDVADVGLIFDLGYTMLPQVVNGQAANSANPNDNVFIVEGAKVELTAVNSDASRTFISGLGDLARVDVKTSGSISPGGGVAGLVVGIIDDTQAVAMRGLLQPNTAVQVVADVIIYGNVEGSYIESSHFYYPITVCHGCLTRDLGDCSTVLASYVPAGGGICGARQDGYLECCTSSGALVCPAVGTMPDPMP
jgi:hypothetical protein